jgi:hypothetical protein
MPERSTGRSPAVDEAPPGSRKDAAERPLEDGDDARDRDNPRRAVKEYRRACEIAT